MSEDELRQVLSELISVPVEQLLVGSIQTLANVAFLRLGVVEGAEEATDRGQARIAIDAIAALEPVVAPRLPEEAAAELRSMLASMRMAYASTADPPPSAAPEGDDPPEGDDGGEEPPAGPPGGSGTPPPDAPPDRPSIWTPRGEV